MEQDKRFEIFCKLSELHSKFNDYNKGLDCLTDEQFETKDEINSLFRELLMYVFDIK